MTVYKAYDEIINLIAAGVQPEQIISYRPSRFALERVEDLVLKNNEGTLTREEQSELDHYLLLEHLMRLAKARAHQNLSAA